MIVRNYELDSILITIPYIVLITATESYMKYPDQYVTQRISKSMPILSVSGT